MLELRTLILTTAVAWLLVAGVLAFILWNRRTYPGFGLWALYDALVGAGLGLMGLRDLIPDTVSIMGGNALLSAGALLSVWAARVFLEDRPRKSLYVAIWAAHMAVAAWFTFVAPSFLARTLAVSAILLLVATLLTAHLLSAKAERYRASARFTAAVMATSAITVALRGVAASLFGTTSGLWVVAPDAVATYVVALAVGVLGAFGLVMMNHERLEHELTSARDELQGTLDSLRARTEEIKVLEGLLPICAACKRIRDADGAWSGIEAYIHDHSEATFTHGICPECAERLYPGMLGDS